MHVILDLQKDNYIFIDVSIKKQNQFDNLKQFFA
jgi:hypothetical protein